MPKPQYYIGRYYKLPKYTFRLLVPHSRRIFLWKEFQVPLNFVLIVV